MKKILVIEDWIQDQGFFLTYLKNDGFNTIIARNSQNQVQIAQEPLSDVVICKTGTSESNKYGILTMLRQDPVTTAISFMFVFDSEISTDYHKVMKLGANNDFVKPLTEQELMGAIAAQLKKQTALQQQHTTQTLETVRVDKVKAADPKLIGDSVFLLKRVFEFIEANYHQSITLDKVAEAVSYSPTYLTKLVRQKTGKSLYRWIIEYRMAAARSLLLETQQPINNIAIELGYKDACHFSRQFRQFHNTTPQTWRSAKCHMTQHKHYDKN
jgi:AraC-like DNA-binding protein/FixJ family two-component response regulator